MHRLKSYNNTFYLLVLISFNTFYFEFSNCLTIVKNSNRGKVHSSFKNLQVTKSQFSGVNGCFDYKRTNYETKCSQGSFNKETKQCELKCSEIKIEGETTIEENGLCKVECKEGYSKMKDSCVWSNKKSYTLEDCTKNSKCKDNYDLINSNSKCICTVKTEDYIWFKSKQFSACNIGDQIVEINHEIRCSEKCMLKDNYDLTEEAIQCKYCPKNETNNSASK